MPEIKTYLAADGGITIDWSKGAHPNKATLKRLSDAILEAKKKNSACANMRRAESNKTPCKQDDSKPKLDESQELFQQLDQEEQKEAVRFMRELIGSRA